MLAAGISALAAIGLCGLSAAGASAAPLCTGSDITAVGPVLQQTPQGSVWGPTFAEEVCNKGAFPEVSFTASTSTAAMAEWNYDGVLGEINNELSIIGTSQAPNATQITNIQAVAGGAQLAVIPVAQTSIAVVANPPEGCLVEEITNAQLSSVFEGKTYSWDQLDTAEAEFGGACEAPITRVAARNANEVTTQFKNYLQQVYKKTLFCLGVTWEETANIVWPETCETKALSALVKPSGNGEAEVVDKVDALAGSIGYATLPEAMANKANAIVLRLQNNGLASAGEGTFSGPAAGTAANCGALYKAPPNVNSGLEVDWSTVYGAKPATGEGAYPLCMLTYVLAFHGYEAAGFTVGQERTVRDYLTEYITQAAGQSDIYSNYYSSLPSGGAEKEDILGAAQKAAVRIN